MSSRSFTTRKFERQYLLELPDELRNKIWSYKFGPIQRELRRLPESVECVVINSVSCTWVDPFPMLSLLISLIEISDERSVYYVIPNLSSSNSNLNRVLEFMCKEGFFGIMFEHGIRIVQECDYSRILGSNSYEKDYTKKIIERVEKQIKGYLLYTDSTILPAKVVDLSKFKNENDVEKFIEAELSNVKHRISAHVPDALASEIGWKMNLFLKEAVCNVFEHAYDSVSRKNVGIYIRHRVGMMDSSLSVNDREMVRRSINNEHQDISRFRTEFPKGESSYLELFVIDSGIGLTPHYMEGTGEPYSFRAAWNYTVEEGKRSKNISKHTQFGGLYTLGKLLAGDFLLARDYDFWTGDILPTERNNASYVASSEEKKPEKYVLGFAVMSRLGIKKPMDSQGWLLTDGTGNCFVDALYEERDIYDKYYYTHSQQMPDPLAYINDERFDLSFIENKNYLRQKKNVGFCIYLPSAHVSKNEIFYTINNKLLALVGVTTSSNSIIIADIPTCECGLYQYAIENATFSPDKIEKIERIILISQRLSVFLLEKQGNTFVRSVEEAKRYITTRTKNFAPHQSLFHMIEWLKTHDSMLFWQYIRDNNEKSKFFVEQKVKWYRGQSSNELRGYLDFEKTLTDSFLKELYHHALVRTLCLGLPKDNTYISEDPLMTGLVNYMNTLQYIPIHKDNVQLVALGSVYVSGITQTTGVTYNINMFLHRDASKFTQGNIMHLFAWPGKLFFKESNNVSANEVLYRRVGSTYSIAPFGWRYFPIPRYKGHGEDGEVVSGYFFSREQAKNIKFESVYECMPKDTYDYWQGRNGEFIGISHTSYETNHDILNINFPFIIRESFLLGGDLACFILGEIISAFGLGFNRINFHDNSKFSKAVTSYCVKHEKKYKERKCSFLVYPFHANTERIMDIIREYIKDENVTMVPLIPLRKERSGTCFQPSPLTIEMIKGIISRHKSTEGNSDSDINVLLFDDAVVDGKTQEEIKHILFSLGVKHVMSIFLLERRRLPYNTSDNRKSSVFWRLDIPRLGSKNNCPLCAALDAFTTFGSQVISEYACKRILEWKKAWRVHDANTQEKVHAIMPVKLNFPDPEKHGRKRFGIYFEGEECKQCGGDKNKIELTSSIGLTLYMGELLSMTSRDDKMLQYCSKEYNLDEHSILEMLCTNLLLYRDTISPKIREKMVVEIFDRANLITDVNNHTAFAALVLSTQEEEVLKCLLESYNRMSRSNKRPNYDMIILLSYLGVRYGESFKELDEPRKLRQISLSEDRAYRMFHDEIFNGNGKSHNRPIGRMKDKAISSTDDIRRVEDALDCILYCMSEIHDWALADWDNSRGNVSLEDVKLRILDFKKNLSSKSWDDYCKNENEIQATLEVLMSDLSFIHDGIFMPLNIISNNRPDTGEFRLLDRIKKWGSETDCDIGIADVSRYKVEIHNIYERWIIWDRPVDTELRYLIENAGKHCCERIPNPESTDNIEMHNVWISIRYNDNLSEMTIIIYNKKEESKSIAQIEETTARKHRYDKTRMTEDFKIQICYEEKQDSILLTKIIFPII